EHAGDVVLGLEEGDAFDPVDPAYRPGARIAVLAQPLVHVAGPGVVGRHGQRIAAVAVVHALEIAVAEADVVLRVRHDRRGHVGDAKAARLFARGARHELHQARGARMAHAIAIELAFLPR